MATRQYIGARYVLKIYENSQDPLSAEWESNTSYEPLTMVNYNSSSYISRKTVPPTIGNPVDNPQYWALSGLYNGQIANLQQQINEIGDQVNTNTADIATKENDLHSGTWLIFGDSYDAITDGWIDRVATKLNVENYIKITEPGVGFCRPGNLSGKVWLQLLQSAIIPDPDDVKYILLVGGGNDNGYSTNDLVSAFNAFISYINTEFTNLSNGFIGYCGFSPNGTAGARQAFNNMDRYRDLTNNIGWSYLEDLAPIPWDPKMMQSADATHPNSDGVNHIMRGILASIMGDYKYYNYDTYTAKINTTKFTLGSGASDSMVFYIDHDGFNMDFTISSTFGKFNAGYTTGNITEFLEFNDQCSPFRRDKYFTIFLRNNSTQAIIPAFLHPNVNNIKALDLYLPTGFDIGSSDTIAFSTSGCHSIV